MYDPDSVRVTTKLSVPHGSCVIPLGPLYQEMTYQKSKTMPISHPCFHTLPTPVLLTSSPFPVSLIIPHAWHISNSTYHVISKLLSGFKSTRIRTLPPCNILRAFSSGASLSRSCPTMSLSFSILFLST